MILPSLIHACNHSATQNIAISAKEAFIILNSNCSLPPGGDCCQRNGKTTFSNMVAWTLISKFEFPILNRLISRRYSQLINVSLQCRVQAQITRARAHFLSMAIAEQAYERCCYIYNISHWLRPHLLSHRLKMGPVFKVSSTWLHYVIMQVWWQICDEMSQRP